MKAKKKNLVIQIDYIDRDDAVYALHKIVNSLQGGVKSQDRVMGELFSYEWSICFIEAPDYREEYINGKWCIVIPSKINKNEH